MLNFIISSAHGAPAAPVQNPIASFLPFILVFGIFYFLMIRPQKKKLEQETALNAALKKGDEIFTKSGLIGTIVGLTDLVITLEVAEGSKLKVLRSSLGGGTKALFEKKDDKKKEVKKEVKK